MDDNSFDSQTVEEARQFLREHIKNGILCPCCHQYVRVYARPITASMARWLIWLVKVHAVTKTWVDVKDSPVRGGDYAKLAHWGLCVNQCNTTDKTKKSSGLWMPTEEGIEFVYMRKPVPSHAHIYANKCLGFSSKLVYIAQALGKKFDYSAIMGQRVAVEGAL